MNQEFVKAFSQVIREQVSQNYEVKVDGIGVFCPAHRKQFQQQYKDGRVVMVPPKDTIKFVPEIPGNNGYQ